MPLPSARRRSRGCSGRRRGRAGCSAGRRGRSRGCSGSPRRLSRHRRCLFGRVGPWHKNVQNSQGLSKIGFEQVSKREDGARWRVRALRRGREFEGLRVPHRATSHGVLFFLPPLCPLPPLPSTYRGPTQTVSIYVNRSCGASFVRGLAQSLSYVPRLPEDPLLLLVPLPRSGGR